MSQKGKYLEKQIEKLINTVITRGYWGQKNHPNRLFDGTYLEGEPFDYYIMTNKIKWAFDTKECAGTSFPIKKKEITQTNNMLHVQRCGFEAFFLVLFGRNLVRFDVNQVVDALEHGRKSLKPEEGKEFDYRRVLE
jgi:penicillin-binding protein-related factor A (putative recombinase)